MTNKVCIICIAIKLENPIWNIRSGVRKFDVISRTVPEIKEIFLCENHEKLVNGPRFIELEIMQNMEGRPS